MKEKSIPCFELLANTRSYFFAAFWRFIVLLLPTTLTFTTLAFAFLKFSSLDQYFSLLEGIEEQPIQLESLPIESVDSFSIFLFALFGLLALPVGCWFYLHLAKLAFGVIHACDNKQESINLVELWYQSLKIRPYCLLSYLGLLMAFSFIIGIIFAIIGGFGLIIMLMLAVYVKSRFMLTLVSFGIQQNTFMEAFYFSLRQTKSNQWQFIKAAIVIIIFSILIENILPIALEIMLPILLIQVFASIIASFFSWAYEYELFKFTQSSQENDEVQSFLKKHNIEVENDDSNESENSNFKA